MSRRRRLPAIAVAAALVAGGCGAVGPTPRAAASRAPASGLAAPVPALPPAPPGAAGPSGAPGSPGPSVAAARAGFAHVYLVVLENQEYGTIVGSADAPYLNGLFARYGLATAMYGVTHPSEPNYIALVSGDTQGVRDDGVHDLGAPSLFDQVEAAGRTWRVYAQGYPGACSATAAAPPVVDGPGRAGEYVRKHDPAISFTSISRSPSRCADIVGLAGFSPAAADFEMVVPNQVNDMHSSSVQAGDQFLSAFLPSILLSPAFAAGSLLIVTFDEGTTDDHGGGHIATLLATPGMKPGTRFAALANHASVLRTVEEGWGMPPLGSAAAASPIPVTP